MKEYFFVYPIASLVCGVLTAVFLKFLIPVLKSKKMGQKILDIGPRWHKDKEGTPTMGGIAFIFVFCAVALTVWAVFFRQSEKSYVFLLSVAYSVLCGLIGVSDDICKLKKSQNEGLSATQKLMLQLAVSAMYIVAVRRLGHISEYIYIPFLNIYVDFGWLYYPFMLLWTSGFNNAVNLTDGVDGLCASVTAAVAVGFFAVGARTESDEICLFSAVLFGTMLGFLFYNLHPAKVFMGDTGSLFLGGAVTSLAVLYESPLILFILGTVYLIEAVSVIIQVLYFKLTGKRFFKMAPIHHHLERSGWSENKIVAWFAFLTLILCIPAIFS